MSRSVGVTRNRNYVCLDDLEQGSEFGSIASISLNYCGMENCEPGHQFGPHIRENYVVHLVLEGTGCLWYGSRRFELHGGQAFVLFPGEETTYRADSEDPWHYCWVGFHGYRGEEFVRNMGFTRAKPVMEVREPEKIKAEMDRMLLAGSLTCVDELRRLSGLLNVISLLMENNESYMKGTQNDYPNAVYVKYAIDYMRGHFKEHIRISELAGEIGITRSYLTHTFKAITRMSPQEYLINIRLENAASQLQNGSDAIRAIAAASGYEDSLAFSKAFKKKYGLSPKQYRETDVQLVEKEAKYGYTISTPL